MLSLYTEHKDCVVLCAATVVLIRVCFWIAYRFPLLHYSSLILIYLIVQNLENCSYGWSWGPSGNSWRWVGREKEGGRERENRQSTSIQIALCCGPPSLVPASIDLWCHHGAMEAKHPLSSVTYSRGAVCVLNPLVIVLLVNCCSQQK